MMYDVRGLGISYRHVGSSPFILTMVSKGSKCKPQPRHGRCTHGKGGGEINVTKVCKYCKKWRCATHCDCAIPDSKTYGKRKGREAARSCVAPEPSVRVAAATEKPEARGSAEVSPAESLQSIPQGRPLNLSVKVYGPGDDSWRATAIAEIKKSKIVVLVTYMYDAQDFQKALLAMLNRKEKDFQCILIVDRGVHAAGNCKEEKGMVKKLRLAGAKTFLAHGSHGKGKQSKHCGSCHIKCCLIDNRVAYTGSANFTDAAPKNLEMMYRHTGQPADDIRKILASLVASEEHCHELE